MNIESTLGKYLEFKIFELFREKLITLISPHCRADSKDDIYKHLFLCPSQLSKKRNFQLKGVLSPFVCLWRTSVLDWNEDFYARSVLGRDFIYSDKDNNVKCEHGFLYDFQIDFEMFSSSYYKSFRDRVNIDCIDFDRLRYFDIDLKELLTDCTEFRSRAEVMLNGMKPTDNIGDNDNRSFDLNATYTVKITVPYCYSEGLLDRIEIYLNENKIYERDAEAVEETE